MKMMMISIAMIGALCVLGTGTALAQAIVPAAPAAPQESPLPPRQPQNENLSDRLNQLESETQALRAEVQWLREHPVRLPAVQATPTALAPAAAPAVPETAAEDQYYTMDEIRGEMKKLAWKKGDFSIVPYGWLWGNMVYATQRTSPGSYTLFVQSASTQPESEFIVDARNTRLGLDVAGPRIPFFNCAESGGKVEIDFQNMFLGTNGIAGTENKSTILLRHAYAEVKNEDFRLLAGQTWDVISPLNPGMLMYSVGWDGGNIGYRRAQVRGERYLNFSDVSLVTAQLSLNQTIFEDSTSFIKGEPPDWPILEGRVAWTIGHRGKGDLPITVGVSGHIGEEQFDFAGIPAATNFRRRTWSGNVDFRYPFTERLGFQAEAFTGENLGAFLGGIGQGVDPIGLNTIRSSGGWCEIWYDWTPALHSHVGYSVDDPFNQDVGVGGKTYNQFYWGSLVYDLTKQFLVGMEVSSWKTIYNGLLPGDSVRCEFVAKYGF